MRFSSLAALVVAASACSLEVRDDFPWGAVEIPPPPQYRVWWELVENCSGKRAQFDHVRWYQVVAGDILVRDQVASAAWYAARNGIVVQPDFADGSVVRHEMLHAVLRDGDHPDEYFKGKCGDVVACGRECGVLSMPNDPASLRLSELDVALEPFPAFPSLARHNGHLSFVVKIRNRLNRAAYVRHSEYALSRCPVGVLVASARDPDQARLACDYGFSGPFRFLAPGETRSLVIDVDLRKLSASEGQFVAEQLVAGAVLADNVLRMVPIDLRP